MKLLLFGILLVANSLFAQDTITTGNPLTFDKMANKTGIRDKVFIIDDPDLVGALTKRTEHFTFFESSAKSQLQTTWNLFLNNSKFISDRPLSNAGAGKEYINGIEVTYELFAYLMFDSCEFEIPNVVLKNIDFKIPQSSIQIRNTKGVKISLENLTCKSLVLDNNDFRLAAKNINVENITIGYNKVLQSDNRLEKEDNIISSSSLGYVGISGDNQDIYFLRDTIKDGIYIYNSTSSINQSNSRLRNISFEGCLINAGMDYPSGKNLHISRLLFSNCIFGAEARFENFSADTVIFLNCNLLPTTFSLNLKSVKSQTKLFIYNTSFDQARLSYTDHMELFFPDSIFGRKFDNLIDDDFISNTFENLIERFSSQRKYNSAKVLDIQYKNWQAEKGSLFEKFSNSISKVWWYYGYKKQLILIWTLFFFILFFFMNLIWWKQMNDAYPIIPPYFNHKLSIRLTSVFMFTAYIFFSLRIDFENLKILKPKFVLFFFCQYIVGLACLFFIFNYLLKL